MNTINHYVGMYPIATGAPVEKPLAKFFFGFFAVMMLAFTMSKKKPRLMVLTAGFVAVAAWMIVDQFVLGHLESHVQAYMQESGTFFKDPERIKEWGDNVRNHFHGRHFRSDRRHGHRHRRGRENSPLPVASGAGARPVARVFSSSPTPAGCGSSATTCTRGAPLPSSPSCRPCFGEGKVAQFSTFSYPYWGYGLLVIIFVCMMLALLIRRKQLREGGAE